MTREAERLAPQADRIRDLRAEKGVSQEEAAHGIGVSVRAYRDWEKGRGGLTPRNLRRLADYFDSSPGWITTGIDYDGLPDVIDRLERIERKLDELTKLDTERFSALSEQEREMLHRWEDLASRIGRDVGRSGSRAKPASHTASFQAVS